MPAWWTPAFTSWLLPAALVGVPVIAAGIVALGQVMVTRLVALGREDRRRKAQEIAAGAIAYRIAFAVLVLAGLFEWAIGANQAVLARTLIADYPAEFWRWINAVLLPVLYGGLFCGIGAHTVFTWRRLRAQPTSS